MKRLLTLVLLFLLLATSSGFAETQITLTFGGDCVLGTREEWTEDADTFLTCVERNGLDWCFANLRDLFAEDDLTMLNLECVLQDGNRGHNSRKQHTFRGQTGYAEMLTGASVELVNLANNHYIDYNQSGEKSTKAALDAYDISYCGYRNLYVLKTQGIKIGFGGCRETEWLQNKAIVYRDIQALKKKGCDVIVYSCHWGKEYSPTHNDTQTRMAQYAVNSGADIIVGTHPHVVQGVEVLESSDQKRKAIVLYSLGNLVFGGTHDMKTFDAMLAQATLCFDDQGAYQSAEITLLPVLTSGSIPRNDFQPVLAQGDDATRILRLVQDDSTVRVDGALRAEK